MSKNSKKRKPAGSKRPQPTQKTGWSLRKKLLIALGAAAIIILLVVSATISEKPKTYSAPPPMIIDTDRQYTATIETNKGNLVLELFAADVPVTVNNFVFLARDGFYNGLTFHRVIPGFMAQGGCPNGDGTGGPGYTFADEITHHKHLTGSLSMARTRTPDTNGSQFFITYAPKPHLDGKHTVFGQLVEGMDVLESLENGDVMTRVTIHD